jgi:hypothetical protein
MTLLPQLIEQLQEVFNSRIDSYKDTLIKEKYKPLPKGKYPRIIIEETENEEVENRSTAAGERTVALTYTFTCYSRDMEENDYVDSVKFLANEIEKFIADNYKPMTRLGDPVNIPFISDRTVMTRVLRFSCVYDYETNLIYKN